MKAELIIAASAAVPNQQVLVNMISRRVRQLTLGHRPMVEFIPGMGHADIALMEIAQGKLAFESTDASSPDASATAAVAEVVPFPAAITEKKKKKAA